MSETDQPIVPEAVYGALEASGFPFQTAIAHACNVAPGWKVSEIEWPWRDDSGKDQFLDIVASNGRWHVALECKKTRKDALTFLRPLGVYNTGLTEGVRTLYATQIKDSTRRAGIFCANWDLIPISFDSAFCVMSTSNTGKDLKLLEPDCQLLIRATNAYAEVFRARYRPGRPELPPDVLFVPVLVTNAQIFTARYEPTSVCLESGELKSRPEEVEPAEFVRFTKSFLTPNGSQEWSEP